MVYKNFRIGLIIRSILFGIATFLAIYSSYQNEWYVTTVVSVLFAILFIIEIIRYAERYKRSLSDFLTSVKSRDFISSSTINDKKGKDLLQDAYNIISKEFQNIRIDKEIQYHYLKTMVKHIKTALLSFNKNGKIEFINATATELLSLTEKQNINRLQSTDPKIFNLIKSLKSGDSELIKTKINTELVHLSIYATEIKIQENTIKLVSLQNIKNELEYHELESWQKLIRVLTHEIMNSVTPISSLSEAINDTINETKGKKSEFSSISEEDFNDMISSLKTIESRSKGLLKFVSSYKQLTRIPKPDFKEVNMNELVNHCLTLLKQKIKENHIKLTFETNNNTTNCYADYDQIEQVVINLLINALDAVKEVDTPEIKIEIDQKNTNKLQLIISDNGIGIDSEEIDKIFIPFYTTKKEGSGIGLSLSRQIMRLHKGSIQVKTNLKKGTSFILEL